MVRHIRHYTAAGTELLREANYEYAPFSRKSKNHGKHHWIGPSYQHWESELHHASELQREYITRRANENVLGFRFRRHRRGGTSAVAYNPAGAKRYYTHILEPLPLVSQAELGLKMTHREMKEIKKLSRPEQAKIKDEARIRKARGLRVPMP